MNELGVVGNVLATTHESSRWTGSPPLPKIFYMRFKNIATQQCPYCENNNIEGKGRNRSGRQRLACLACGRSWSLALEMEIGGFRSFLSEKGFTKIPNIITVEWLFEQCQVMDRRMSHVVQEYEQQFYPDPPPSSMLTTQDIAVRYGSSRRSIGRIAQHRGIGTKINGRLFFTETEVEQLRPDKKHRPKIETI